MTVDFKKIFFDQVRKDFAPALRTAGFKGSGTHYRRVLGEVINTISIQTNRYGGRCAVNLGLHLTFLPLNWKDELPDPTKIKEIDCEFRERLAPPGMEDYWWDFGSVQAPPSKSLAHLMSLYFDHGEARFRAYHTVEAIAQMYSLDQLRHGSYMQGFGNKTVPRAALAMARIHQHLGDDKLAAAFARVGLDKLGSASGVRSALERLAGAA